MSISPVFRPWCWALFWLSLFMGIGGCIYFGQEYWRREVVRIYASGELKNSEGSSPAALLIGDSLVRMSFPRDIDAPLLVGADMSWGKIWIPGGSYIDFAGLASVYPKGTGLVLVNQDILLKEDFWNRRRAFRGFWNLLVRTVKTGSIEEAIRRQQQTTKPTCEREARFTEKVINNHIRRYTSSPVLSDEAIEFLRLLDANSKQLVVIRLPRSSSLEERLSAAFTSFQPKLLDVLDKEGIQHVELGPAMPDEFYCDGSHPNELGKAVRTEQLVKLVREKLLSTR
ncbi:hypothetical protein [Porticoccus sp.]